MAQIWEELARGEAADLAIHGNQNLKQEGANSIYDFIRQYLDEGLAVKGIQYELLPLLAEIR
ncbi:hypothetical protein NSB25_07225 [Acetatifactor muris]|uniref:Uncharacterized protein n=1 Tax=Acetatifactor muris TaxID=879566 RepID=A0A2K4ZDZ3_9FIRM|nr:hypothetical protein [Acetatifactor muris]MCR2047066.1 hypothetical protein [Acetatifactor muris]SOY28671.1 hypothetical protein AMURIS_01382 [Acetatifactor muris]